MLNMLADGLWPCPLCDGRKRICDPSDPPCPIEGDKMRNRITCTRCHGAGNITQEWWLDAWQRARDMHTAEVVALDAMRALMRQALAKLTVEEAAALGWEKP